MTNATDYKPAGFWTRLLATWVDCLIIYTFLTGIFYLLVYTCPTYFPFPFTFFVLGILYSALLTGLSGQTWGKRLFGLQVLNSDGSKVPFAKALLRESILKILSGLVLFLGFFQIGFSKNKKGWHDRLAGTQVLQVVRLPARTQFWRTLGVVSFLLAAIPYVVAFGYSIYDANQIGLDPASVRMPYMDRAEADVTDAAQVQDTAYGDWLVHHTQSPEDYLLQVAQSHQITLLGEAHENGSNLKFFNQMIAPLYHKAGVRVIGMEVIPASYNKKVAKLISAETYDTTLAMEIARSQSWQFWGLKEYWDVLHTVWQLNRSLPPGAEPMQLIGLDCDMNMANVSLLGISKDDSKGRPPFWEKFRVFSVIKDLPNLILRDKLMARTVENEILGKNRKAVILIGFNHTMMNYTNAVVKDNKVVKINPRFAFLLNQNHPGKLFQIELFLPLDLNDDESACPSPTIDSVFIRSFAANGDKPCAFDVAGSPFEKLRDHCAYYWADQPTACYGDLAQGLIFLTSNARRERCTWTPGYISDEMYMCYKPLYQLITKNKVVFNSAADVNRIVAENN